MLRFRATWLCSAAVLAACSASSSGGPRAVPVPAPSTAPPPAPAVIEPVVLSDRRCWPAAPASGLYALPEDQALGLPRPARSNPVVAIVDGCVGIAGEHLGIDVDGSFGFDGVLYATGERHWSELLLVDGQLALRDARDGSYEERDGPKIVGTPRLLVPLAPLEAEGRDAQLALLEHESPAARIAALERLLPNYNEPAICSALVRSIAPTQDGYRDQAALDRLVETLRGSCGHALLRSLLEDPYLIARAAERLNPVLTSRDRPTLLLRYLDHHLALPSEKRHSWTDTGALWLLPPHPQVCVERAQPGANAAAFSTPLDCLTEDQASAFVRVLDAYLERTTRDAFARELILKLLVGFLRPRLASVHLLSRGPKDCTTRLAAMGAIAPSVHALQPEDIVPAFERALAATQCPAARERALVMLAALLQSNSPAPEAAWALLLRQLEQAPPTQALREELKATLVAQYGCAYKRLGDHAPGDALMQRLGIERCYW